MRKSISVLCVAAAAACGGGGGSDAPTSPGGNSGGNQTVASVSITGNTTSVTVGSSVTLSAVASNSSGQPVTATFTWSSSNPGVATVGTSTGTVTGVAPGSATISASAGGVTGSRVITVNAAGMPAPPPLNAIISMPGTAFEPSSVTIRVGGTVTFVFTALTHNVAFNGSGAPANIPDTMNANVDRTFNTAGSYTIICTLHAGMTGNITVQ